jgi:hypothetical protein
MSLISLIVTLVVIGLLMYLVLKFVPMENNIRQILVAVVVIVVVLWLLSVFGILGNFEAIRVGR